MQQPMTTLTRENESTQLIPYKPQTFGYMIPGTPLSAEKQATCRCVLHVAARNPEWCNTEQAWFEKRGGETCYNPYAVCVASTHQAYPGCTEWYNFTGIPTDELIAYAQLRSIPIPQNAQTPQGREQLLKNIGNFVCRKKRGKSDPFCAYYGPGTTNVVYAKDIKK